jgi:hypothetical protein
MNPRGSTNGSSERNDGPRLLLATVVRLLPHGRKDWGRAMAAELDGIAPPRDRWSFAIGCAATVARQFTVLRSLAYTMVTVAAVAGVAVWSRDISYAPLRWGVMGLVVALAAVITLGRVPGPLGPVASNRTAGLLRSVGFVAVAVAATGFIAHMHVRVNQIDEARYGVPIIGSMLLCYLVGIVAVTAHRSLATARALRWGAVTGTGAALAWLTASVAFGRLPASPRLAFVLLLAAVPVVAYATARHPAQVWVGSLVAGTIGTLLIVIELVVMATYAPARMIPDLAPAALTPADDLAQSRAELQDPYVALFVIGGLIGLTLAVTSMVARTRRVAAAQPVGGAR